jgi:hypothetical protein
VVPKVVFPLKVTTALGWSFWKSKVDEAGMERLSRRMLEHEATAEATSAAAVTVHVVPPLPVTAAFVAVGAGVVAAAAPDEAPVGLEEDTAAALLQEASTAGTAAAARMKDFMIAERGCMPS